MASRTVNVVGRLTASGRAPDREIVFQGAARDFSRVCDEALDALCAPFAGQDVLVSATFRVLPVVAVANGEAAPGGRGRGRAPRA